MQLNFTDSVTARVFTLIVICTLNNSCAVATHDSYQRALQYYESKAYSHALPLLHDLVKADDDRAMVLLAQMYKFNEGVSTDPQKVHELLLRAANHGNAQAQYLIASYYFGGKGFEPDFAKAFEWNMKAALKGHKLAQLTVGQALLSGTGVTKDICKAREWFEKSSLQGDGTAKQMLAETDAIIRNQSELFCGVKLHKSKVPDSR